MAESLALLAALIFFLGFFGAGFVTLTLAHLALAAARILARRGKPGRNQNDRHRQAATARRPPRTGKGNGVHGASINHRRRFLNR